MLHDPYIIARRLKVCAILACCSGTAVSALAQQSPTIRVNPGGVVQQVNQDQDTEPENVPPVRTMPTGDQASDSVSFAAFSEPVELTTLIDYIGNTLGINIVIKGTLSGSVVFNAPVEVPRSELLDLLDALLEQYDASITQDASGIYTVQARAETPINFSTERATSKVIDTAGLRPSGLTEAINAILGRGTTGTQGSSIAYIDELGVIVMTGTTRDIRRIETLIAELRDRYLQAHFTRIELLHIAAPVARERVIQLAGSGSAQTTRVQPQQQQPRGQQQQQQQPAGASGGALDNIADRLTVDAQDNALIFRGNDTELAQVIDVIRVIDVPNRMERRQYFAGTAVRQIADLAKQRALGEVILLTDPTTDLSAQFRVQFPQQQGQQSQQTTTAVGGPVMIVDERRQSIIYYGTIAQQTELAEWIKLLDVGEDAITLEYYKLANAQAVAVAEIIQGLISGQSLTGTSPLLPGAQQQGFQQNFAQQFARAATSASEDAGFAPDPTRVFVIADESNNQVIVKAPKRQQDEFRKLVQRLDLRRPQVYIEATIISVSDTSNFRLAIEGQLKAGQYQAQTNFGLSTPGETFQDPRNVSSTLAGFTSALIRSDSVPFVINAIKTTTDTRILAAPQLLVNDNEEASIASIEEQPTVTRNIGQTSDSISFQGYEQAGTTLVVTPSISEAGYIRLLYAIELSTFLAGGQDGIPPPRRTDNVNGTATIPSDATIVLGGITLNDTRDTILKIPLLGDIPLLGHLFRDTTKAKSNTVLYIFITPRIMTDPTFADLRLLTKGPQSEIDFDVNIPPLQPKRIERASPPSLPAMLREEEDIDA